MALRLVCVIVAALTGTSGYFFPSAGIMSAQAVDRLSLLFLVMAATSLNEFHHSGQRQAIACRR